jgi:hypothetical protein
MSGKFSFPDPKRGMTADLTIDTDQLEAFAAGAKERKGGHRPWDKHDPKVHGRPAGARRPAQGSAGLSGTRGLPLPGYNLT